MKDRVALRQCVICNMKAFDKEDLNWFVKEDKSKFDRQNLCKRCAARRTWKWRREAR